MSRSLLILKLFLRSKFIFKNPSQSELVIFDDESLSDLRNVIHDYNFFVLQSRIENINKIYFSFKILKYFLKNYNGNIMTAYLASLLEIINPKVVLTFIDTSLKFCDLAKILDKKMNFMAIQNSARTILREYKFIYEKKLIKINFNKKVYIPNFLCFGQFEIDHYKQYRIKVKNFIKVGSLRLANFMHYINKNKIKIKKSTYDICLISSPAENPYHLENFEESYADTVKFTIKFCKKHNMRLIFARKRKDKHSKIELNFYRKYLTNSEYNYLIKHSSIKKKYGISRYASYMSMIQSEVTVCSYSTMLTENLGLGGKILCSNLLPTNIWNFPIKGISTIKNCNYQEFEKRLIQIHSMSKKNYFSKLKKDKNYIIAYDKKVSTIEILKREIDYFLADKRLAKN